MFRVKDGVKNGKPQLEITFVEHTKLTAMVTELSTNETKTKTSTNLVTTSDEKLKRKREDSPCNAQPAKNPRIDDEKKKEKKDPKATDIMV